MNKKLSVVILLAGCALSSFGQNVHGTRAVATFNKSGEPNTVNFLKAENVSGADWRALPKGRDRADGMAFLRGYNQDLINPKLLNDRWTARWISVPGEQPNEYGVYLFRRTINVNAAPEKFIINVSADNRYKLYVNGNLVSLGPARCDVYNWCYETVDIAKYMKNGKNVLAAIVWNFADKKPVAQMSYNKTGLMIQGNTDAEQVVNTDTTWVCAKCNAYSPWQAPVIGYYAAGACEKLDANQYIWNWQQTDFDDSAWVKAKRNEVAGAKGARDYPDRQLVPTPLPQMERAEKRMVLRKAEGVSVPQGFTEGKKELVIPANTTAVILLDNKENNAGYPVMTFSKGKNAEITLKYAESLYLKNRVGPAKGNRNEIEDKEFIGSEDVFIADGGMNRTVETLWWRTWRYMQVTVKTGTEPLTINDIHGITSHYPFKLASSFDAPADPDISKMIEIGWRTALQCAHETYMDCPYYEQLQYFGDSRIQAMVTLFNTNDKYFVKRELELGRQAMLPEGITESRFPESILQIIPGYSLSWIDMVHDYWMYRGDDDYVRSLLPNMRNVITWYLNYLKDDFSLARIPYWFFTDWAPQFKDGECTRDANGNSSIQDLMLIIALDKVADIEMALGTTSICDFYRQRADQMRQAVIKKYWDNGRKMFADTGDHDCFSQHANSLAIISGTVNGDDATALMERILTDKSLTQATIFYSFFVDLALKKAGLGDRYLNTLSIWRDQIKLGLTTWAEMPEPSRSDCHAWGASPNIFLYNIVLGISSEASGFNVVRIEPSMGSLKKVSGTMPSPNGDISVSLTRGKGDALTATVTIPQGVSGSFVWKGKEYKLNGGTQTIKTK